MLSSCTSSIQRRFSAIIWSFSVSLYRGTTCTWGWNTSVTNYLTALPAEHMPNCQTIPISVKPSTIWPASAQGWKWRWQPVQSFALLLRHFKASPFSRSKVFVNLDIEQNEQIRSRSGLPAWQPVARLTALQSRGSLSYNCYKWIYINYANSVCRLIV